MRSLILITILACFLGCSKTDNTAQIQIHVHDSVEFVKVNGQVDGLWMWLQDTDTVKRNEDGQFIYKTQVTQPYFLFISAGNNKAQILIEAGHRSEVDFLNGAPTFVGSNAQGHHLINDLKRSSIYGGGSAVYARDNTAALLESKADSLKAIELKQLYALKDSVSISDSFYQIIKKDIDYSYANDMLGMIVIRKWRDKAEDPLFDTLAAEIVQRFPLEGDRVSMDWSEFSETVLNYHEWNRNLRDSISKELNHELYEKDLLYPRHYELVNQVLEGVTKEKYLAVYIQKWSMQKKFERSLVGLFDSFKAEFPESQYIQYISPSIAEISEFYVNADRSLSKDIVLIDQEYESFDELISNEFEGEKVFVDLWATWCGPCKAQFKHNDKLAVELEKKDYKKLFISIDKPGIAAKWEEFIKHYDLKGSHLLASQAFKDDFEVKYSTYEGGFSIPQYLIVDAKGMVTMKDAPNPSELEELVKAL